MNRTWIIAKREYTQIAKTRAFLITLFVMPLFMAGVIAAVSLIQPPVGDAYMVIDRSGAGYGAAVERRVEIDYQRGVLSSLARWAKGKPIPQGKIWSSGPRQFSVAEVDAFIAAGGAEAANREMAASLPKGTSPFRAPDRRLLRAEPPQSLKDAPANATFVLPKEAPTSAGKRPLAMVVDISAGFATDHLAMVVSNGNPSPYLYGLVDGELTRKLKFEAIEKSGLDPAAIAQLEQVGPKIAIQSSQTSTRQKMALNAAVPAALGYLLMITVMITGMMLLQSVIEERSNKLIESVLACVAPQDLMQGKLLGICAVGLTVIVVWGGFALLAATQAPPEVIAPIKAALASINTPLLIFLIPFYYLTGYLAFAMLFLGVGAMSESMQDAQAWMTPLWILLMVPYILLPTSVASGSAGTIPLVLSWIPLYTPFAMMFRMGAGVGVGEVIGSGVLLIAFIAVEWVLIGKLFKASLLRTGQPKLGEVIRRMMTKAPA